MCKKILPFIALLLLLDFSLASAQHRRPPRQFQGQSLEHKIEITPYGGYSWTLSRRVDYLLSYGEIDIKSGAVWGVAVDFTLRPGAQLELLYHRQDSKLTYKELGIKSTLTDMAVEYWHGGGVYGIQQGNIMPFTSFTLGATRFVFKETGYSDEWKFSMILGLGVKAYLSDRAGLRLQFRMPFTLIDGGGGFACGPGGCYTTIGGYGVSQFDLTAGLIITL